MSSMVQKVVSGNDSKIVKNVAIGEYGYAAKAMMSNAGMKAVAFKCFEADIKAEFKYLCLRKIVSMFSDRSPYNIANKLTGKRMEEEISAKAPTFYKCLRAAANILFLFYKLCHNTKKTLQIVTGNHNSFWPITVIPDKDNSGKKQITWN